MQQSSFESVPDSFVKKWQEIADLIAGILDVPAALIMKVHNEFMEVFASAKTENNPYNIGDKEHWYGLYCETVIKSQKKLHIPNALKDKDWDKNPDLKLGMIAYLGYPLNFPDKTPFGTICVLDNKERYFTAEQEKLLFQFKNTIELDLALICAMELEKNSEQNDLIKNLLHSNEEYQIINEEYHATNEDLQQSKKMAEESELKFRLMYENTSIGIGMLTPEFKIMAANKAYCEMLGYTEKELIGKTIKDITHPEILSKNIELLNQLKQGEIDSIQLEKKYIHKNGHTVYGLLNLTVMKSADNEPLYYLGNVQDITERKRTEQALQESEEKYRELFEANTDSITIFHIGADGKPSNILEMNDSALQLVGYTREEMKKLTPNDFEVYHTKINIEKRIKDIQTKGFTNFETIIRHKDGHEINAEIKAIAINYKNQPALMNILRDITVRKKQEQAIAKRLCYEENLARFSSTLLLDVPDVINKSLDYLRKATDGSRVYIFENFIDAQNKLSMKQTYEVCAKGVTPQIHNPVLKHIIYDDDGFQRWRTVLADNKIINAIVSDLPEDERNILESQDIKSILAIPVFVYQKWFGFIGFDDTRNCRKWTKEDIELLRTSAEILGLFIENQKNKQTIEKRNIELIEANATKNKFFNIIAHDLKNPFASILGFSDLLLKKIDNYDKDRVKQFVKNINESGKSTFKLLENLLEWSRTQQDKIPFKPEKTNLYYLAYEASMQVGQNAKDKQIGIDLNVPDDITIEADSQMLNTIIRNLLSNAIKFTPENGEIKINGKHTNNGSIILEISDTGTGMDEQTKNALFKIDKTTSKAGTKGEKGTGFGLLLCKEFMDKHNGTIRVESEVGKGSQFIVALPLKQTYTQTG